MTEVVELRTYTVAPGRLEPLLRRFREVTLPLFARHGITVTGPWWFESEGDQHVVYLLAFDSAEERDRRLQAFRSDPEWQQSLADSEIDGPLASAIAIQPVLPIA